MASMSTMMATEREMASALATAPAMPAAPAMAPAPPTRPITANEYAAAMTRMVLSTHAAVRQLGQQQWQQQQQQEQQQPSASRAETAQLLSCVDSHVRALCQQLLHASKWIVDAEARATAAEKHVAARDAEVVALRKVLGAKTEKTETTSEASACTLASDSESAYCSSDEEEQNEDPVSDEYDSDDTQTVVAHKENPRYGFMMAYARTADMLDAERRSHEEAMRLSRDREAVLETRLAYANADSVLVLAELTRVREEHDAALHQLQGALHSSQQELADAQISLRKQAALKRELKQDLAQSQYDSTQLYQRVQSLKQLVEAQDEGLCRGDAQRLSLQSDVARLTTIQRELEEERDELKARVQALEASDAGLRQELKTVVEAAAVSTSEHAVVVCDYEALVERMRSELVDLRSEVLFFVQQQVIASGSAAAVLPSDGAKEIDAEDETEEEEDQQQQEALVSSITAVNVDAAAVAPEIKSTAKGEATKMTNTARRAMSPTGSRIASLKTDIPRGTRRRVDTLVHVAAPAAAAPTASVMRALPRERAARASMSKKTVAATAVEVTSTKTKTAAAKTKPKPKPSAEKSSPPPPIPIPTPTRAPRRWR